MLQEVEINDLAAVLRFRFASLDGIGLPME
jgi:hypothetical protein